jgi:hypothetical protein
MMLRTGSPEDHTSLLRREGRRDAPRRDLQIRFTTGLKPDALRMNPGSASGTTPRGRPSGDGRSSKTGLTALSASEDRGQSCVAEDPRC